MGLAANRTQAYDARSKPISEIPDEGSEPWPSPSSHASNPSTAPPAPSYAGCSRGTPRRSEGPAAKEGAHHEHPWWQVMCLTGVDYFSTLGYQPGIAALAAGALSPVATLILVLLTLFGALPIYRRVARESPHGEGSIAMLEHLLSLVAGQALRPRPARLRRHRLHHHHHPLGRRRHRPPRREPLRPALPATASEVAVTLVLIALLGAVFLKGFKEAIGIAVVLVAVYLLLNAVVIGDGLYQVAIHPQRARRLAGPAVRGRTATRW